MLLDKIQAFVRATGALRGGETYVVGVSGGVDSVSLLHALLALAPLLGISLHVAHLDHGLRGEEAAADARFVADLARAWDLPATVAKADVPRYRRERGVSTEVAARAVRYAFFADLVRRLGASAVVVAHNADDQVETVLLHVLRGSGLAGLRGMAVVQQLAVAGASRWAELWSADATEVTTLTVLRPVLTASRAEVEAYAAAHGLTYRRDPSNEDRSYVRNRVRHELLPLLETYNSAVRQALGRMARLVADDYAYLQRAADEAWPRVAREEAGAVALALPAFQALDPALRRLVVRRAVAALVGEVADFTAAHAEEVLTLAEGGRTGAAVDLPAGLRARRAYGEVVLAGQEAAPPPLSDEGVPLQVPGDTLVSPGDWRVSARVQTGPCAGEADRWHADFDLDSVGANVVVRRRRPGDRLRPVGLHGSKKVQDILVDRKVPRAERDAVPVVASAAHLLWVVGHAVDERGRASAGSKRVLCLRFRKEGAS